MKCRREEFKISDYYFVTPTIVIILNFLFSSAVLA